MDSSASPGDPIIGLVQSMNDSVTSEILTAFSIIVCVAWWNDWPPVVSSEVTTYHATCFSAQECKTSDLILYRTVYRSDVGSQTVTSWGKEDNSEISLFHRCAIQDKNNWKCAPEKDGMLWGAEMHDGIASASTQTSWYRWWWLKSVAYLDKK